MKFMSVNLQIKPTLTLERVKYCMIKLVTIILVRTQLTSLDMMRAVTASQVSERATKSPKEDILSAPLALA